MLLEFRIRNFRSFYSEAVLSMVASTRQREHRERLMRTGSSQPCILPSAVIYGANASGKTSLVMALALMKEIVMEGSIKHTQDSQLLENIELFPFVHDYAKFIEPVRLEVSFWYEGVEYTYSLALQAPLREAGQGSHRRIIFERLLVDEVEIFTRTEEGVNLATSAKALRYYSDTATQKRLPILQDQINQNLDALELFLTGGFKNVVNMQLAQKVLGWFSDRLWPMWKFDEGKLELSPEQQALPGRWRLRDSMVNALWQRAEFGPQDVAYVVESGDTSESRTMLRSRYRISGSPKNEGLDVASELIESKGTVKLLQFALPFIAAIRDGIVLVVDELDASIHPELIAGIIRIFNNPDINTQGAQLIFNTHNPIYLDNELFRRDQILFVSRDNSTFESELYSLADFKTHGEKRVRDDERYMKNYLAGKYGALPFVDFEGAFLSALTSTTNRGGQTRA